MSVVPVGAVAATSAIGLAIAANNGVPRTRADGGMVVKAMQNGAGQRVAGEHGKAKDFSVFSDSAHDWNAR